MIPESLRSLAVPIDSVHLDPANVRRHPEKNLDALKGSLARFGQQKPIVVDAKGVIVAGNGTWEAAKALGWTVIAAIRTDLAGSEAVAFAIADNRTAELAVWDNDALGDVLRSLEAEGIPAELLGFDQADLETICGGAAVDGLTDPDDVPAPPAKPITRPGDLWILGEHRLLCGDATITADVERLLDGAAVHMIFMDPPYGHNNNDGDLISRREAALGRGASGPKRPIANDGAEANNVVQAAFREAARLLPGGCCCCCCCCGGGGPDPQFARWSLWLDEVLDFKQMVVWDKGPMGMGWHYRRSYETVLVAQKPGAACKWYDETNAVENIIRPGGEIKKIIPRADQHPTEKPAALAAHFMRLHSLRDENVLDLFGGSGSTMIASEQTGRRAFLMEIDPLYCDVIVQRWEKFTGRKAERSTAS